MRFIRFCVNHPVTIWMLVILVTMLGILSIVFMNVELLPNISVPTVVVITKMTKAGPQEIEEKISKPLEEILNTVSGLKSLSSRSKESVSHVKLEFQWGTNIDLAIMEIKEKLYKARLPEEADTPYIWRWDPSSQPIFRFDIYDKTKKLSLEELKAIAKDKIKPRIERIKGVGSVQILGGREYEYKIALSRKKMRAKFLTILQIIERIQRENINIKAGRIIKGKHQFLVRVIGKARSKSELESIVVATRKDPTYGKLEQIFLRDVADIRYTLKESGTYARIDENFSIGFSIKKSSGGNVVDVIDAIKKEIRDLKGSLAMNFVTIVSRDDSKYILQSQNIVISNILQGVILAACLVMFFVRDIRGAILMAFSIPFSIIAAFSLLYAYGLSRNILTLGGMALAAGMVLDGSIVILENIHKHIEYGKKVMWAAIDGTSEVAMGIVTSGLTTILVFLPLLFTHGIIREIFKDLALAIIAAIIFSTVIGIIFMPMMGARILRQKQKYEEMFIVKRLILKGLEKFDILLEMILEFFLKIGIKTRPRRIFIVFILMSFAVGSILTLPSKDFIPKGKVREIQVDLETPAGSTLEYTDSKAKEVEKILKSFRVDSFHDKFAVTETVTAEVHNQKASVFVKIKFKRKVGVAIKDQRNIILRMLDFCSGIFVPSKEEKSLNYSRDEVFMVVEAIRNRLRKLAGAQDTKIYVNVLEKVNPQGVIPLKVSIVPKNPKVWTQKKVRSYIERRVLPSLKKIPGSIYFRTSNSEPIPELEVKLNKQAVTDLGGDTTRISQSIRCFITGYIPTTIEVNGKEVDVRVQGQKNETNSITKIRKIPILTERGTYLTVGSVSDIAIIKKNSQIDRKDKKTTLVLHANQIPFTLSKHTLGDIMEHLDHLFQNPNFPPNAPKGKKFKDIFFYNYEGQSKDLLESSDNALIALITSIILIYMIMCCQFESLSDPFVIMITVPLSFPGVALLLHLTGEEYSLSAMVGFICLGGVVVNNGIILIEFVNILRDRGMELKDALIAASKRKLRSILITSFTSILGMLPIVLGVGEGCELYRGCCSVILGGLLVSTPLTLLGVPVFYMIMEDIKEVISMYFLKINMLFTRKI